MAVALITLGLLAPAGAAAAPAKPGVTNGAAANVAQTTATVTGKVNPNEVATTYFFEYGTTQLYGQRTPDAPAGSGNSSVNVAADLGGLAPATRYHYRLVAFNSRGVTRSGDRTFTTKRQPLGLSLAAAPNPIRAERAQPAVRRRSRARATATAGSSCSRTRSRTRRGSRTSATRTSPTRTGASASRCSRSR